MEDLDNCWFRKRHYLHFDRPIGQSKATDIVTSPKAIAQHSFYPFLSYDVVSRKIFKKKGTYSTRIKFAPSLSLPILIRIFIPTMGNCFLSGMKSE